MSTSLPRPLRLTLLGDWPASYTVTGIPTDAPRPTARPPRPDRCSIRSVGIVCIYFTSVGQPATSVTPPSGTLRPITTSDRENQLDSFRY